MISDELMAPIAAAIASKPMIAGLNGHGSVIFDAPQQRWYPCDNPILQRCYVAGLEMMVIQKSDDEPHLFELSFANFRSRPFEGMTEAKAHASEFSRQVIVSIASMIRDDFTGLPDHLD